MYPQNQQWRPPPLESPFANVPPLQPRVAPLDWYQSDDVGNRVQQARSSPFEISNVTGGPVSVSNPPSAVQAPSVDVEIEDELPLLEELGIYPGDIWSRMVSVLLFQSLGPDLLAQLDMTGPTVILLALGCMLLLSGKVHFGYIYALSTCGSFALWILLNLMSKSEVIDLYRTLSILGYSLLPIVLLALAAAFWPLKSFFGGSIAGGVAILWSTATASRFFEAALCIKHQRFLIAFPVLLFYAAFVLLTIF